MVSGFCVKRRHLLLGALLSPLMTASYAAKPDKSYIARPEVLTWAKNLSLKRKIPYDWLVKTLSLAHKSVRTDFLLNPIPRITLTPNKKDWIKYRDNFVNAERIQKGRDFLRAYQVPLEQVAYRWNVTPEIITAIIGIETIYGKSMGRFRVLDVLTTQAFDASRRESFYKEELASFLEYTYKSKLVTQAIRGSYAGAIGLCQFMPSNILKLGVDFDRDGLVNLIESPMDAIASVANYLKTVGYRADLPIAIDCVATETLAKRFLPGGIARNTTLQNALDAGFRLIGPAEVSPETEVFLIDLPIFSESGEAQTLWRFGTVNYEAILHYNRSYFYAESVRELSLKLIEKEQPSPYSEPII